MGRRRKLSSKKPVTAVKAPSAATVAALTVSGGIAAAPAAAKSKGKSRPKPHAVLIAAFHAANKQLEAARKRGDATAVAALERQLDELGGIERYQRASVKGEDLRSTNTSKWLLKKLATLGRQPPAGEQLVLLDVGALRVNYARVGWIDADPIDLNAQASGITQVDFFDYSPRHRPGRRPYDVVSLSLVVNFVPDPKRRGEMLRRCCGLLKPSGTLFVVLPRACVENSRYVTDESIREVFAALGLTVLLQHTSAKLAYYVLSLEHADQHRAPDRAPFKRRLLRAGGARNNFSIGLPD